MHISACLEVSVKCSCVRKYVLVCVNRGCMCVPAVLVVAGVAKDSGVVKDSGVAKDSNVMRDNGAVRDSGGSEGQW